MIESAEKYNIDSILFENRKDTLWTWENFKKEPFFVLSYAFYSILIIFFQKDFKAVREIHEKRGIPVHSIDLKIAEIVKKGHKWYNPFIFIIFFISATVYLFLSGNPLTNPFVFVIVFFFSLILYLAYFIFLSVNIHREQNMANKSIRIIKKYHYKKPLLIVGKFHKDRIKEYVEKEGVSIKEID